MELTSEHVALVLRDCTYEPGRHDYAAESTDTVRVEGIAHTFQFDPQWLQAHVEDIGTMLAQLPEAFSTGGGWTFLNACLRRDGVQWGEHVDMEALFCLGMGLGLVTYVMPREMWDILPGGMPYVHVLAPQPT